MTTGCHAKPTAPGGRLNPPATPAAIDFSPMNNAGVRRGKKGAVRTRLGLPVSLTVAVLPHADDRGRVAAALAAQRQVADEGVPADARAAKQEQPGNVGDPAHPEQTALRWE
jgi:hypothetical protein